MEKRIEAKGNIIETLEGERFRILELVSESRMSVVYRAERLIEDGKKHNVLLKAFVISEKFEYSLDVYQEYVRHELEINQKLNAIGFTGAYSITVRPVKLNHKQQSKPYQSSSFSSIFRFPFIISGWT